MRWFILLMLFILLLACCSDPVGTFDCTYKGDHMTGDLYGVSDVDYCNGEETAFCLDVSPAGNRLNIPKGGKCTIVFDRKEEPSKVVKLKRKSTNKSVPSPNKPAESVDDITKPADDFGGDFDF